MLQSYINNINHNRYLKLYYTNTYNYSKLSKIIINIKFKKSVNNKFNILCTFFLFKNLFLKNGFFIILNKRSKKILGMKFILKNQLMYKLIDTKLIYLLNQQEIQNTVKLSSFDTNGNYVLSLKNISEYYFEKLIQNNNFKAILNNFDMSYIFILNNNNSQDNIFYLNMFKFYFN